MLVISITCSYMSRLPSNFMVVSLAISVPARDLSADLNLSSTFLRNSLALSVWGRKDLMLLAIVMRMNLRLSLFDLTHASWDGFSTVVLVSVMVGLSSINALSRSSTPR